MEKSKADLRKIGVQIFAKILNFFVNEKPYFANHRSYADRKTAQNPTASILRENLSDLPILF